MREKYEAMSLVALKELAKARGIRHLSTMKKKDVIDSLLAEEENGSGGQETKVSAAQTAPAQETEPAQRRTSAQETAPAREAAQAQRRAPAQEPASAQETAPAQRRAPAQEPASAQETAPAQRRAPAQETGSVQRRTRAQETSPAGRRVPAQEASPAGRRVPAQEAGPARREAVRRPSGVRREDSAPRREISREDSVPRREISREDSAPRREISREEAAPRREISREEAAPRREISREETVPRNEISREDAASRREVSREETPQRREAARPENFDRPPMDLSSLDSGMEVSGVLEVLAEGYGFIRSDNYLPGENDVYVAPSQIRRFGLKTGDIVCGNTRIRAQQEKFSALLYLKTINGFTPSEAQKRYNFEDMTPVFPYQRMRMERSSREIASRVVDLFSPIGKGQRGMIVSPPKAGKTTLLKDVARSILQNEKDMHLLILLIDERPEEVTDIREAIVGNNVEVIYSTFDELPEHHKRVSEMGIERAKRLVEYGKDVTILLDSITRLARAYNLTVPPSGRTLSGGLDPAALHMPKRFFGAARKMREGGSLTILATALVDTGSKMDDVVYEEFKGTGNMELVLDRKLSERRIFPAIDIQKSSTRREDLLLTPEEQEAMFIMRKALNGMKSEEAVENILNTFVHTRDNAELVAKIRRQRYV